MPTSPTTGELINHSPDTSHREGIMADHLKAKSSGFESTGEFVGEAEAALLQFADPEFRESVTTAASVLTAIAKKHELFLQESKKSDEFGRWRAQIAGRQLKMSELVDSEPHKKDSSKGIRKAIELWASRGLLRVTEVATKGRPVKVVNLDLIKFENMDALTAQWVNYWAPIKHRLTAAHVSRMHEFYSAGAWVAKIDFSCAERTDLSPHSFGSFKSFSKGQIVPVNFLIALQGTGMEPDHARVEPLGDDRIVVSTEHKCVRCHNVSTSYQPVSLEAIAGTQKGAVFQI